MRYEIRRACLSEISRKYDHTEIVEFARTSTGAVSKYVQLVPHVIPSKEAGIFDAGAGRWLRGYMPRVLSGP